MTTRESRSVNSMRLACKLSGARWMVWLSNHGNGWAIGPSQGFSKAKLASLRTWLSDIKLSSWLAGALASGRVRWRECGNTEAGLNCGRIYIFPNPQDRQLLVVGSDGLDMNGEALLKVLATQPPIEFVEDNIQAFNLGPALSLRSETTDQLAALRETELDIISNLDLPLVLQRIVQRAQNLASARGAEIGLIDQGPETDSGVRVIASSTPWQSLPNNRIPLMAGLAGKMAVLGEPVIIEDYNVWQGRLLPERIAPFKATAGVPLKLNSKVIGTLVVMDDRPEKTFTPGDIAGLEILAPQAAIAVHNAQLFCELQNRMAAQLAAESRLLNATRLAAIGEMAGGIAHELNNPLTSVTIFLELALKKIKAAPSLHADSSMIHDLELALEQTLRARAVIRRLLNMSRDTHPYAQNPDDGTKGNETQHTNY